MAYGRLDVFWPDGMFKTFPLVENSVSVGRSSGNSIALETTTISRYHFSITYDNQQVYLTDLDSANGTFIDGVRLKGNEPRALYGGEEIQVGHLRIIYHHIDEMPTQPITPTDDTTQRIEMELPTFRLDVIGPDEAFSPGAHMAAELAITNTSETPQRYRIEASGMPAEWIRIDRSELHVDPKDTAPVLVNFRPIRRSDSRPGNYTVVLKVSLKDNPEAKLEASLVVRILPFNGFGMALENRRVHSGDRFRLHVHNQGSANLPLTVSGRDSANALRYNILAPQVSLAPGQRLVIQGEIKPTKPALFGKPRIHPFDLQVRSNDAAHFLAVVRGQFIEKPMLPAWMPFALAGGMVVLGVFLVLILTALLQPPPPPFIADFSVGSTQIAQGEPLSLNWIATDVSDLTVSVNGTPVMTNIGAQTSGLSLDTTDYSGSVVVSVIGANGNQQVAVDQLVYVYKPLGEPVFTVDPPQLVRYVVQNLTVNWSVPGAVTTRLSGLETFSNLPVETTYGMEGTITGLVGIPSAAFTLTLYAEDEVGNARETLLEMPIINPECRPAGESVTLYGGPDGRHQVVGTVPSQAFVVVDAQDSSGQWLRAQLPGGLSGWGVRAEFSCAPNFNVADLLKELSVPTVPPPSPTPIPSNTPVPTNTPISSPTTAPRPVTTPTASG
ncbi:MAG: FHA domain-containing protein [Anaerolineae bacterium]|nr:FHA domain-containing protein [Anaerolineae bacterium]